MTNKVGLWKKQSKKGTSYYSGQIKIEDKEYWIRLFKNTKENDNQPDLQLYLDEKEEVVKNPIQSGLDDQIFKEFGKKIELKENGDLAF